MEDAHEAAAVAARRRVCPVDGGGERGQREAGSTHGGCGGGNDGGLLVEACKVQGGEECCGLRGRELVAEA